MKTLVLKRHGLADYAADRLTPEGAGEIAVFAQAIKGLFNWTSAGFFSSPSGRAFQTAELVSRNVELFCDVQKLTPLYDEERDGETPYREGVGKLLPHDLQLAFCVTHLPNIETLLPELDAISGVEGTDAFMGPDVGALLTSHQCYVYQFPSGKWIP